MALQGMISHLEGSLWHLRFWNLEINKFPGQVPLKIPMVH